MEFSRQEYWSGLPCPPPGNSPNQGIEPGSSVLQVDSLSSESPGKPLETIEGVKCQFLPPSFVMRVKWACVSGIALWAIERYADPVILIVRWRSSCSSFCLPSAYLPGLPSSPSFWDVICFLWQKCLSALHFQIYQCSRCFLKPSMATFPALSPINPKTSPLFISARTFVFLLEHFSLPNS